MEELKSPITVKHCDDMMKKCSGYCKLINCGVIDRSKLCDTCDIFKYYRIARNKKCRLLRQEIIDSIKKMEV